ncbi:MAG: signal transduction histidine kinase [Verrucomicrobiales bacterium]|jgi:signal transduction histidine kinase
MNRASQILVIGLVIALAIAAATLVFGQRTRENVQTRNASPARAAADSLQREVDRLTGRYERYLQEAFGLFRSGSTLSAKAAASELIGVVRLSGLSRNSKNVREIEIESSWIPVPRLATTDEISEVFQLAPALLFTGLREDSGWVYTEGSTAYFWQRMRSSSVQVATIDLRKVRAAMSEWLGDPQLNNVGIDSLLTAQDGAADQLVDGRAEVVWTNAKNAAEPLVPHRVFTVSCPLGRWQLLSQDPVVAIVEWRLGFLVSGVALAFVVAIAALFFSAAFRRALALSEQRVSFVNSVSHELRTPITNILIQGDLAAEELGPDLPEPRRRLGLLREEAARLSRLVDNVLTFSRREQGKIRLRIETVQINEAIQTVLENFRPTLRRQEFKIDLELDSNLEIETDADALAQILTNLISNVEKYAKSGKWLGLTLSETERGIVIRCADRGPGIPENRRSRVFEAFYRSSDSLSEGVSGAGLGLTIARDMASRLGGELVCLEPESGETGAIFEFTLPLTQKS